MWFSVIKMPPNPHGGEWSILSREEYYQMNDKNKIKYHSATSTAIQRSMNNLREILTDKSNLNIKSPMLVELAQLQHTRNFHERQV